MKRTKIVVISLLVVLAAAIMLVVRKPSGDNLTTSPLLLHCAAGMRGPVTRIARRYEMEFGTPVHLQFGGSGALETQLEIAGGDLFLPADASYIDSARAKGLVREAIPVSILTAGIVVPKGNPENLRTLIDLTRTGIRLSLADPSAAIGRHTRSILGKTALLPRIEPNIVVTKPTVNNCVEDVATGAADATLAWDSVGHTNPDVDWIPIPEFSTNPVSAAIGVLTSSRNPTRALHFARYLTARGRGLDTLTKAGFPPPEMTDTWAETPELTLIANSNLRSAIQDRIREFEQREGCRVTIVFEDHDTPAAMMKDRGNTPYPQLAARLGSFLNDGTTRFENLGFSRKLENTGVPPTRRTP